MSSRLSVNPNQPDAAVIAKAAKCLTAGGLVILPTEAIYGIACDPNQPEALKRLQATKGRDANKPITQTRRYPAQVRPSPSLEQRHPSPLSNLLAWTANLSETDGLDRFPSTQPLIPIAVATTFGSSLHLPVQIEAEIGIPAPPMKQIT